jgi:putative membrane protein
MEHLSHGGYTNVSGMTKDDKGVWHGQATNKGGKSVAVTVDYQGSVTEQ